eukprot:TRINITY_DN30045_c0_g2_i1.p1 TRINITY_DN30045_c0_g2~~TRINITY_DN30045_c0_g2_i1.p1  ORF type:complete len:486 (+),score=81.46 TRINITY_DN30045_c0_g2_i1:65-1459(+)
MAPLDLETDLYYGVDDKVRPWIYFSPVPRTAEQKSAHPIHKQDMYQTTKPLRTIIHDARHRMPDAKLDETSFELASGWKPSLSNADYYQLHETQGVKEKLYKEVSDYLKDHLKATAVRVIHHQVRNEGKSGGSYHGSVASYAKGMPHTDSSSLGGDETYLALVENDPELSKLPRTGRYMYLNMWRNISAEPIVNNHLAVLDERTVVKPDDYIVKDLIMTGGDGSVLMHIPQYSINSRHHHLHKWYYFPKMKDDEALLFKQADSDHTKPARICFHVAVPDASAPENAPARESIELRCIAVFCDEELNTVPTKELISKDQINTRGGLPSDVPLLSAPPHMKSFSQRLLARLKIVYKKLGCGADSEGAGGEKDEVIAGHVVALRKAMQYFSMWPQSAQVSIVGSMKQERDDATVLRKMAEMLSKDETNHFGLKSKSKAFQDKVAKALSEDDKFREAVSKHILSHRST